MIYASTAPSRPSAYGKKDLFRRPVDIQRQERCCPPLVPAVNAPASTGTGTGRGKSPGGLTILPETHAGFILYSQQERLRPIVDPVPGRTISLVIRSDYIHEAKLNAVVDAVKRIIPGTMLDGVVRKEKLRL